MLSLLLALAFQDAVAVPAHDAERRWLLVSTPAAGPGPFTVSDADGKALPAQVEGGKLWVLLARVPAGKALSLPVKAGDPGLTPMALVDDAGGWISVRGGDREITRYHHGAPAEKHKKPFWWPLNAAGVNVLRSHPVAEARPGEAVDHPHHSGMYHAFGEVNGKEYWSKLPIMPKRVVERSAGAAFARLVVEHAWGEDLAERQEIRILNAGDEAVVDFAITLTASGGPAVLGQDLKMAKEGSFAVRVGAGLSMKGDAPDMILDSKGNKGEKAVRADTAPWVEYAGKAGGKDVAVAVMNHPASFRYPTTWHVRAYGLFAANPWLVKGKSELAKGESMSLGYRVHARAGGHDAAVEQAVFAAFAGAR
jgi:hypothetical protein